MKQSYRLYETMSFIIGNSTANGYALGEKDQNGMDAYQLRE